MPRPRAHLPNLNVTSELRDLVGKQCVPPGFELRIELNCNEPTPLVCDCSVGDRVTRQGWICIQHYAVQNCRDTEELAIGGVMGVVGMRTGGNSVGVNALPMSFHIVMFVSVILFSNRCANYS